MKKIVVKKIPKAFLFLDRIMTPIMFLLGGLRADSIQETHPWHIQELSINDVNPDLAVEMDSNVEDSKFENHKGWLFHSPILGGWTKYSVFEVEERVNHSFYLGWIIYYGDNRDPRVILNILPITDRRIRCLNGNKLNRILVFAIQHDGKQIMVRKIDEGTLEDNKYKKVRLI